MTASVVADGWREAEIGELNAAVTSGSRGWGKYYSEAGHLFIRITNLSRENINLDLSNSKFVRLPDDEREGLRTSVQNGDVLISITADIGIAGIVDDGVPKPAYINQHIASVRFPVGTVDGRFVAYYLASEGPQKSFRAMTDTGAKAGMSLGTVRKIKFQCPPLAEQQRVASALKDIDDFIASLDALIAKKRDIKQAAMQQLLTGKMRLPGFKGEWVSSTVGQVCDVRTGPFGAQLHESDYVNDGTPIITVEHLGEFGVQIDEDVPLVSDADRKRLQNYSLRQGDIVFSRVGSIDRNALIGAGEEGWLFSGRLLRLRPEKTVSAAFLSQTFHSDPFKELVRSVAVGQTMPSLNTKIVKALPILLPSKPEQDAIAQVFADIDGDLALSEARIAKAKGLKQGMMQQLLTGRIRLV